MSNDIIEKYIIVLMNKLANVKMILCLGTR